MKILALSFLIIANIATGAAFAAGSSPQPLTRADCDESGMAWNDKANVCGSNPLTSEAVAAADNSGQPLTRAGCVKAGMTWNDRANICGSTSEVSTIWPVPTAIGTARPGQPLTRADCGKRGMVWNDRANICSARLEGSKAQPALKVESAAKAERSKPNAIPMAKQHHGKHAYTQRTYKYRHRSHTQPAQPDRRPFFRLFRNQNRPAGAH
jgi:hypothetical protein